MSPDQGLALRPRAVAPARAADAHAFSIVMPVWNKKDFLAATLATVLAQKWGDFELIAVDDGSTDGSSEILRAVKDPRFRIIAQANAGPGAARNAGIEAARHDWIALVDADDLWLPGHLAELDRIRSLHPAPGLIATAFFTARPGRPLRRGAGGSGRIGRIDYLSAVGKGDASFTTSSCAIHRRVYREAGGFGPFASGEDAEYWARIALDWPVAVSDRATVAYLLGTGGITDRISARRRAQPPREVSEISPAAALLVSRAAAAVDARKIGTIHAFLDAEFRREARHAARIGDVDTLRSLRPFAPPPRAMLDRLLRAIGALPRPIARAMCRIGLPLWLMLRPLRRAERHCLEVG